MHAREPVRHAGARPVLLAGRELVDGSARLERGVHAALPAPSRIRSEVRSRARQGAGRRRTISLWKLQGSGHTPGNELRAEKARVSPSPKSHSITETHSPSTRSNGASRAYTGIVQASVHRLWWCDTGVTSSWSMSPSASRSCAASQSSQS